MKKITAINLIKNLFNNSRKMRQTYYEEKNIELYAGEALKILKQIPDKTFDMIFADPPYFLSNDGFSCQNGKMVKVNKGEWDKSNGFENDFNFNYEWIKECKRILKDNGTIWISGTRHNIFMIGFILQKLEFHLLNEISWFKPNAAPNLSCRYFTHSHETVLWARKDKKIPHKFNYLNMKNWDNQKDLFHRKGKQMRSIWQIPTTPKYEKENGKHPTQKPIELLKRIVTSSTNKGDLVLDPFNGSGTTGVVCKLLGRKYIGIDLEKDYLKLTKKRLRSIL